jgi:TonB family protein
MTCSTHRLPCAVAALALGCASTPAPVAPDPFASCAEQTNWSRPAPIVRVEPVYPESALRERIEGYVEIESSIGPRGQVVDAVVVDAEPPGEFETAALTAIAQWRYCPPTASGHYPDRIWTRLHFDLPRSQRPNTRSKG